MRDACATLYLRIVTCLFSVCHSIAIDLRNYNERKVSTLPPSALIDCTPAKCSRHLECSWKYCPMLGQIPKCVEGNYTETCCVCSDEVPNILSLMISSRCVNLEPSSFQISNIGGRPAKICHQLFTHDKRKDLKIPQPLNKNSINHLINSFIKRKTYFDFEINRLHRKKRILNMASRINRALARSHDYYLTHNDGGDVSNSIDGEEGKGDVDYIAKSSDGDTSKESDSRKRIKESGGHLTHNSDGDVSKSSNGEEGKGDVDCVAKSNDNDTSKEGKGDVDYVAKSNNDDTFKEGKDDVDYVAESNDDDTSKEGKDDVDYVAKSNNDDTFKEGKDDVDYVAESNDDDTSKEGDSGKKIKEGDGHLTHNNDGDVSRSNNSEEGKGDVDCVAKRPSLNGDGERITVSDSDSDSHVANGTDGGVTKNSHGGEGKGDDHVTEGGKSV